MTPVVLVTGGAGGLGTAIADALQASGMRVALADLEPTSAWPTAAQDLLAGSDDVSGYVVDVRDAASCQLVVDQVVADEGRLDVLVNNAGTMVRRSVLDTSESEWSRILDVNLTGAFRMCQAAYPSLRDSPAGCVVNVLSTHALRPAADVAAYAVSKAALAQLTRVLAVEWAPDGLRVNGVAPSIVRTEMTADLQADPDLFASRVATIPLGRDIGRDDVAAAVAFLASPAAGMVTGSVLAVDGGELIGPRTSAAVSP